MKTYSTREAAKKLGITGVALGRYINLGKVMPPQQTISVGNKQIHAWTDEEIERVRKLLPKIANGRKTRYQKQKNKPQATKPVPRKKKN